MKFEVPFIIDINLALEQTNGEITPEIEALEKALVRNADDTGEAISMLDTLEKHYRNLAEKNSDTARKYSTLKERIKCAAMLGAKANGGKLIGENWSIKVTKCKPSLIVNDESQVPNKFKYTKEITTVDKNLIHEALKLGEFVPGVELTGGETIRIGAV